MVDPLAEVVTLLQPTAQWSKRVSGAGAWRVHRSESGQPFYCAILAGGCRLEVDGGDPLLLEAGDFVLIPAAQGFTMSGLAETVDGEDPLRVLVREGETRHGSPDAPADVELLVGYCRFGSPDAALLVSLLPQCVLVRGERRLTTFVQVRAEESRAQRPARDVVLGHLVQVLLIEALRSTPAGSAPPPGLVRGLADARLSIALRRMHDRPTHPWTVPELAKEAALSRSAFFERFSKAVGMPPMEYLLAWRMALAKKLLRHSQAGLAEVAERVGYSSAGTFNVAFTRHVGVTPGRYVREQLPALET